MVSPSVLAGGRTAALPVASEELGATSAIAEGFVAGGEGEV